jgi:hypothetical protein
MGMWKARFFLKPVHKDDLASGKAKKWESSCKPVQNIDAPYYWARQNVASIQSKKEKYIKKWDEKPDSAKPMLNAEDGL